MRSKLDLLTCESIITPEQAYCLGGIISAAKNYVDNGRTCWVLPVIHNPVKGREEKELQAQKIDQHRKILEKIVKKLSGKPLLKPHPAYRAVLPGNKRGFAFSFSTEQYLTFDELLDFVKRLINPAGNSIKQAFVIGAFDGRCSFDKNSKMITLDCLTQTGTEYIKELLARFSISCNYNTARQRKENYDDRKPQLRINSRDVPVFMKEFGLISTVKREIIASYSTTGSIPQKSDTLPGLHIIIGLSFGSRKIPLPDQDTVEVEHAEEEKLQHAVSRKKHVRREPKGYAGKPKVKKALEDRSGGRKVYPRNAETSLNALILAEYKCECDGTHETFIRKKDGTPYTEPHHLIPLSCHAFFDVSLDTEENIVSLCSNCHNKLHYGRDIEEMLHTLYNARKDHLTKVGIDISFSDLLRIYKKQTI